MHSRDTLRLLLDITGKTQTDLSRRLNVSFVTFNRWLNGKAEPRQRAQHRITSLYKELTGAPDNTQDRVSAAKLLLRQRSYDHPGVLELIQSQQDIHDELVLRLTYTSIRIEGSTLTEAETEAILFHNDAIPRRSLIEQLEAKNHQAALEFLFRHLAGGGGIDEDLVFRLHAILMNSIRDDAGLYRTHGVRIVGANVPTANHLRVPSLMEDLLRKPYLHGDDLIRGAAAFHSTFEQIHPFSDGNGRIGRMLMHAMLLTVNYPPAVIRPHRRRVYHRALNHAQRNGDLKTLEEVICRGVLEGWRVVGEE